MDSPILNDIRSAIVARGLKAGEVHVSISENPVLEEFSNGGAAWVKWLCWSINDDKGVEVIEPQFEICCSTLTAEQARSDFGERLLGLRVVVDHDIDV